VWEWEGRGKKEKKSLRLGGAFSLKMLEKKKTPPSRTSRVERQPLRMDCLSDQKAQRGGKGEAAVVIVVEGKQVFVRPLGKEDEEGRKKNRGGRYVLPCYGAAPT